MSRRIDLNDVRLLMQVVEHGSYTAAARAIGIPKSTISQRIATLEGIVGTGLIRRTSRSFSLTEAGSKLLPHARAIEDLARQLEQSLMEQGHKLQGTLRLSCSSALAQFALSPLVPRFLAKHDQAIIRVEASNRLVDIVGEGFDMALRGHVGPLKDSTLRQRVVAHTTWMLAASPDWLGVHGIPGTPQDVPQGETLCFSTSLEHPQWTLLHDGEEHHLRLKPRLLSDDMVTLRSAAIAAGGITCLPEYVLGGALRTGQLVRLLPGWSPPRSAISLLSPPKPQSSRLAGAFSDFLAADLTRTIGSEIES